MDTKYNIFAWRKSGPAYAVSTWQSGFSNRRNRWIDETVGSRGGRSIEESASYLLSAELYGEVWGFNRGHQYLVSVRVDDSPTEEIVLIDAMHDYVVQLFPTGLSVQEITASVGDDEDNPPDSRGISSDEEE